MNGHRQLHSYGVFVFRKSVEEEGQEDAVRRGPRVADGGQVLACLGPKSLLDEAPQAYKPIDVVMRGQADLVEIEVELSSIANYKGVERR